MNKPVDVLFLAADSSRSKAYAQVMQHSGLSVSRTLLLRKQKAQGTNSTPFVKPSSPDFKIVLPDLEIPLVETVEQISDKFDIVENYGGIKRSGIIEYLSTHRPKLVIYSGYGGELVPEEMLGLGIPFLHLHSGWLPEYRGSTTVYYSLLNDGNCGVTAILLKPEIDNGDIVARKKYPAPPSGVDIDHLYDNAIRADLLSEVLAGWMKNHEFEGFVEQDESESQTYYVIHPVLKHLAILSTS
jgi:methionyl-tRNA formyltransferase